MVHRGQWRDRLDLHSKRFKAGIKVVVIDPSASWRLQLRSELLDARFADDRFHLVVSCNRLVTKVRHRATHGPTASVALSVR